MKKTPLLPSLQVLQLLLSFQQMSSPFKTSHPKCFAVFSVLPTAHGRDLYWQTLGLQQQRLRASSDQFGWSSCDWYLIILFTRSNMCTNCFRQQQNPRRNLWHRRRFIFFLLCYQRSGHSILTNQGYNYPKTEPKHWVWAWWWSQLQLHIV